MLGRLDPKKKQIVIVGAGLSGLLVAYELSKNKLLSIQLYEASQRVGGLLKTENTKFMLGERAANSFLATPSILKICEELGVEMLAVKKDSRSRFIFRNNRPRKWPLTLWESILFLVRILRRRSKNSPNEESSLSDWADFYFGEGARKYLLDPFCTGIYACPTQELCVGAVFPQLNPRLGQSFFGKILELIKSKKEKAVMVTSVFGLEYLCQKILVALSSQRNVQIHLSSPVKNLEFVDFSKSNLILATNSSSAFQMIEAKKPQLAASLKKLKHASLVSVVVNVAKEDFESAAFKPKGVGVLLCPGESESLLGILFNSSSFEGRCKDGKGQTLTLMFKPDVVFLDRSKDPLDNPQILKKVEEALALVFKTELVKVRDMILSVWLHTIPIYNQDLYAFLKMASKELDQGQVFVGSYTGKLGIRSFFEDAQFLGHQMSSSLD